MTSSKIVSAIAQSFVKDRYPALAQYDTLLKQHNYLTGYYREKSNKKMQETTQQLMIDKKLMVQLKQISPNIANKITRFANDTLKKGLELE